MPARPRGLYETLLTQALAADLEHLPVQLEATTDALRSADAADRIALHLGRLVERALDAVEDKLRVEVGIALAGKLVAEIARQVSKAELAGDTPNVPGTVLRAIAARLPDGTAETITGPLIPLLDTTLLTNAPGEPRVGNQLLAEIHSADRVDVVMAFVRLSGIRPRAIAPNHE